jgi:hypothetical protein
MVTARGGIADVSTRLGIALARQRTEQQARAVGDAAEISRRILDSCHPKQRAFVEDPARRVCALVGRGGGKTTGARGRLVRCATRTKNARCLYIAVTRGQAEELMWGPLKELLAKLAIPARFNETKLRCTLANGSTIRLVGADKKSEIEKLRGQPFHEVAIDEAASYPGPLLRALLTRIIGPRLGDYGGCLVLYGTPGHILSGPFYEATRPGTELSRPYSERHDPKFKDWIMWSAHSWSLEDGAPYVPALARLLADGKIEKRRQGWSDDNPVWKREYLGLWAADDTVNMYRYRPHLDDGTPWNQWDPPRDAYGVAVLDGESWEFVYGHDMGHSDPYALEVFAFRIDDPDRCLYHVYEFVREGMYAREIAKVLLGTDDDGMPLGADNPGGLIGATGWPSGNVADMDGLGGAVLEELRDVYGVVVKAAEKKHKHDAIELMNGDLIDGYMKILKGSKLEAQLMALQWTEDDYGGLKEPKGEPNHSADAALYARREARHLYGVADLPTRPLTGAHERRDARTTDEEPAPPTERVESWMADGEYLEFGEMAW